MPPARGGKADALVILLHGYGSNGADLISLAPYWAKALPGAGFVAPNGIAPLPEAPGGFQWFPITQLDPHLMEQGVRDAAPSVDRFIDRELDKHGLPPERCALVGFSQGTMMALHVGLRRSRPLAAILGFSGVLVGGRGLKQEMASKPPVLLIHGDRDPTIPIRPCLTALRRWPRQGTARPGISRTVSHTRSGPTGLNWAGVLGQQFQARAGSGVFPPALPLCHEHVVANQLVSESRSCYAAAAHRRTGLQSTERRLAHRAALCRAEALALALHCRGRAS